MEPLTEDNLRWLVSRFAHLKAEHGEAIGRPDLVLPTGDTPSAPLDREGVRTISIRGDEQITFDNQPVSLEQLGARIAEARASKPDLGILIRPHRDLPVQKFSEVLDAVRRSGVKRIGFVQTPKEG